MSKRLVGARLPTCPSRKLSYWLVTRRQRVAKLDLTGRVLDFGCGGGGIAEDRRGRSLRRVRDLDPRMIEIALEERP